MYNDSIDIYLMWGKKKSCLLQIIKPFNEEQDFGRSYSAFTYELWIMSQILRLLPEK